MEIKLFTIKRIYNSSLYTGTCDLWHGLYFTLNHYLYSNYKQFLFDNRFRKNMYLIGG